MMRLRGIIATNLLLCCLCIHTGSGQVEDTLSYFPLREGKVWKYMHANMAWLENNPEYLSGDTLVFSIDSVFMYEGKKYFVFKNPYPVMISNNKAQSYFWNILKIDGKGNIYNLVNNTPKPLFLFGSHRQRETMKVPFGTCEDCVTISREKGSQAGKRWTFCRGVGLVKFLSYDHADYQTYVLVK